MSAEEVKPVAVVALEPGIEETVAPPAVTEPEVAKEESKVEGTPATAAAAAPSTEVIEPLKDAKDDGNKEDTLTHAQSGTAHTDAQAATTLDGTPAPVPETTEPVTAGETATDDKKSAAKDKVEKTKSEGKGFFAKFFGSREKSPKPKKIKTPKTEKADPIAAAAPAEGAAVVTESEAPAAEVAEPAAAAPAEVVPETAPVAEAPAVETTEAAPAEGAAAPDVPAKEDTRPSKPNRRLSARFTGFIKNVTKVQHHKEEHKDAAPATATEGTEVAAATEVAPKIEEPTPSEPLKISEPETTTVAETSAPPAAPVVAATA